MQTSEIEARIRQAVEAGFDDQTSLIAELAGFASTRGNERGVQQFMAGQMKRRGLAVDMWRIEPDDIRGLPGFSPVAVAYDQAYNVVGTHRADPGGGRSLILNGHVDVVPSGPEDMWDTPPFDARIGDGFIRGRGAGDMKAGLASSLFALDALRAAGFAPAGDLTVQSVVEEEATGNGTLACLQRGYSADAVLIPEPTSGCLVTAQLGVIWFTVTITGSPHHVLEPASGGNPIRAAQPIIEAVYALGETWNETGIRPEAFAEVEHPINVNVGRIQGGNWPSSVPARCTVDFRIGVFPGQDLADARREIEAAVAGASSPGREPPEVTYTGFLAEGVVFAPDSEAERVLRRAHRTATSRDLQGVALTATTDGRFFGLYRNIPTLVYGHTAENIHGVNERVDLASVKATTLAIALFIAEWCGLSPVG